MEPRLVARFRVMAVGDTRVTTNKNTNDGTTLDGHEKLKFTREIHFGEAFDT